MALQVHAVSFLIVIKQNVIMERVMLVVVVVVWYDESRLGPIKIEYDLIIMNYWLVP